MIKYWCQVSIVELLYSTLVLLLNLSFVHEYPPLRFPPEVFSPCHHRAVAPCPYTEGLKAHVVGQKVYTTMQVKLLLPSMTDLTAGEPSFLLMQVERGVLNLATYRECSLFQLKMACWDLTHKYSCEVPILYQDSFYPVASGCGGNFSIAIA